MNRKQIIFLGLIGTVVLMILFIRPSKKEGESENLHRISLSDVKKISYSGEASYKNDRKIRISYTVTPHLNPRALYGYDWLYQLESVQPETSILPGDLGRRQFYGGHILKTMVDDVRKLEIQYRLNDLDISSETYGLRSCENRLHLEAVSRNITLCLGKSTYGNANKYLYDPAAKKAYLGYNYVFTRWQSDIWSYQDQRFFLFEKNHAQRLLFKLSPALRSRYPLIFSRLGGKFEIHRRESVNPDGKKVIFWQLPEFPEAVSTFFETLSATLLDGRFIAFLPAKTGLSKPDVEAEIFSSENEKIGEGRIWLRSYDPSWKLSRTASVLNPGDNPAETSVQSGVVPAAFTRGFLERLDQVETQIAQQLDIQRSRLENARRKHVDPPLRPR